MLTKHRILHWIDYGTLLGAVRHHGKFVPWEYDADLTIWSGHWETVKALGAAMNFQAKKKDGEAAKEEEEWPHYFYLVAPGYARVFESSHNGIYVDLYTAGPTEKHNPDYLYMRSGGDIDPFHKSFLEPMSKIGLEGLYLPCPNRPSEFLKTRYGAHYMDNVKMKIYDGPKSQVDEKFGPDPEDFVNYS
jgi:phosphorylcholine metabolism protein LicD